MNIMINLRTQQKKLCNLPALFGFCCFAVLVLVYSYPPTIKVEFSFNTF